MSDNSGLLVPTEKSEYQAFLQRWTALPGEPVGRDSRTVRIGPPRAMKNSVQRTSYDTRGHLEKTTKSLVDECVGRNMLLNVDEWKNVLKNHTTEVAGIIFKLVLKKIGVEEVEVSERTERKYHKVANRYDRLFQRKGESRPRHFLRLPVELIAALGNNSAVTVLVELYRPFKRLSSSTEGQVCTRNDKDIYTECNCSKRNYIKIKRDLKEIRLLVEVQDEEDKRKKIKIVDPRYMAYTLLNEYEETPVIKLRKSGT